MIFIIILQYITFYVCFIQQNKRQKTNETKYEEKKIKFMKYENLHKHLRMKLNFACLKNEKKKRLWIVKF